MVLDQRSVNKAKYKPANFCISAEFLTMYNFFQASHKIFGKFCRIETNNFLFLSGLSTQLPEKKVRAKYHFFRLFKDPEQILPGILLYQ